MNFITPFANPWIVLPFLFNTKLSCVLNKNNFQIDVEKIKKELDSVLKNENFQSHKGDHDGGWGSIGLITYGGNPYNDLVTDQEISPTRILDQCPEIKKIIDSIPGKKARVRFMEVTPKSKIYWHYDNGETVDHFDFKKNARLHLPILTNPKVKLNICHENLFWESGKLYYGDFSFPHSIHNESNFNRIHLVIDVVLNNDLLNIFPQKFLKLRKRRLMIKKICQRSLNLYKKLNLVENG